MNTQRMQAHLDELEWVVSKGFQLRHHPFKQFEPFIIQDAIYLIRLFRQRQRTHHQEAIDPQDALPKKRRTLFRRGGLWLYRTLLLPGQW